jgi:aspartyl-tRNA(Asn)/glutamyl-tRNA(Gln) amidotransferase subunit B
VEIIEGGGRIHMETRAWDAAKMVTRSMRSKEEAHDYRYFPEPDLVPLVVDSAYLEKLQLPELPEAKRARLVADYGIPEYDAGVLTAEAALSDFFETTAKESGSPKAAANWIMGDLMAALNKEGKTISQSPVSTAQLSEMIKMIDKKTISGKIAKVVFEEFLGGGGKSAQAIVKEKGLVQVSDEGAIEKFIDEAIAANPGPVEQYKSGKEGVMGFLVGAVMKVSKGKANPGLVNKMLKEKLQG